MNKLKKISDNVLLNELLMCVAGGVTEYEPADLEREVLLRMQGGRQWQEEAALEKARWEKIRRTICNSHVAGVNEYGLYGICRSINDAKGS